MGLSSYEQFVTLHGRIPFPASFHNLANWLSHILQSMSVTTAQAYLSGVRNYHVDRGLDISVFDDERIKRIIKGAKRKIGIPTPRLRKEITKDILLSILPHLSKDTHDDLNIYAAFCIAFAAFLRCGEFTWDSWHTDSHLSYLSRGSVQFQPHSVILHLPSSKTDPFRHGISIPLARSPDATCPVTALSLLFTRYPSHSQTDPFFSRTLGPFNQTWVLSRLQSVLLAAGIDPTGFSGHSFRRGAANSAVAAGISRSGIMELGRWKSDAVDRYFSLSTIQSTRLALSQQLNSLPGSQLPYASKPLDMDASKAFDYLPPSQDKS